MVWFLKPAAVEDVVIIGGLIAVQFVCAGNSVLMSYVMSLGIGPLTIVLFSTFATFLVLSPPAFFLERKSWPDKFSLKLILQVLLISFGGVTLFQTLFLKGIKLTSPAMATAMPNLAPGLIFIIASTFRFEKVKLSCLYSKIKILGTSLCVIGAFIMSVMNSTKPVIEAEKSVSKTMIFDVEKIIGCMYLLAAVFVLSCNAVLQAATLGDFPAPISLCALTSLIGVVTTAAVQFLQDHKLEFDWQVLGFVNTVGYSILIGIVGGTTLSFCGWAMKKRGPVFVSMFSPVATVISVVLSAIALGDRIDIGSLAGMFLMFTGLYFVLWAKGREGYSDDYESEFEAKKPLLS